jgi:GTP cyclohydrolase III
VDIDEVEKHADVEFIVGVGVAEAKRKKLKLEVAVILKLAA